MASKANRVVQVLLRLEPQLHKALKARAVQEDRPASYVIRAALREYLEARAG